MFKQMIFSIALMGLTAPLHAAQLVDLVNPEFQIPCKDGPDDMVTGMPGLISELSDVKCTTYGQILTAPEGFIWKIAGTHNGAMSLLAQNGVDEINEVGNKAYFISIEGKQLSYDEIVNVFDTKLSDVLLQKTKEQILAQQAELIEITAINNKKSIQNVYIFMIKKYTMGFVCTPKCIKWAFTIEGSSL
ncbi:hypothetical protein [Vibrio splendidus]|uniref:hypothetical protein n=1 Tax=Vibrio splendidus TaxID=29497 RepID=UPI000E327D61|nr:hypothetical protein [Vibrio splendidus]